MPKVTIHFFFVNEPGKNTERIGRPRHIILRKRRRHKDSITQQSVRRENDAMKTNVPSGRCSRSIPSFVRHKPWFGDVLLAVGVEYCLIWAIGYVIGGCIWGRYCQSLEVTHGGDALAISCCITLCRWGMNTQCSGTLRCAKCIFLGAVCQWRLKSLVRVIQKRVV